MHENNEDGQGKTSSSIYHVRMPNISEGVARMSRMCRFSDLRGLNLRLEDQYQCVHVALELALFLEVIVVPAMGTKLAWSDHKTSMASVHQTLIRRRV